MDFAWSVGWRASVLVVCSACGGGSDAASSTADASASFIDSGADPLDGGTMLVDVGPHQDAGGCTLIGCTSGATVSWPLAEPVDEIPMQSLEFCRNTTCFTADFSQLSVNDLAPGVGVAVITPDPLTIDSAQSDFITAGVTRGLDGGAYTLDLSYALYMPSDAQDGDSYSARLLAADGGTVQSLTNTVHYTAFQPNGAACGPTCYQATLTP